MDFVYAGNSDRDDVGRIARRDFRGARSLIACEPRTESGGRHDLHRGSLLDSRPRLNYRAIGEAGHQKIE